ncbi:hypothetical protein BpHYR1_015205 [Brachionus plicatilis]|uniref:Uncharacterized protein n=1 Tax=Brachionus plicatilis TaxID=10195 RepID=A0A3M7PKB6_BRAPC|nr:hypothetical protein BpHYR1_015205 [Brachionus plicatilis]
MNFRVSKDIIFFLKQHKILNKVLKLKILIPKSKSLYFFYLKKLKILNLMTYEERRKRGDLIQMYKLVKGMENINLINGINYAKITTGPAGYLRRHDKRLVRNKANDLPHKKTSK